MLHDEVLGEARDIADALAQGRHRDLEDVDPVEQVLAELLVRDHVREVLVRRGDDPHVDLDGLGPADRCERTLLEHAQELHLKRGGHISDLVEEERAAIGDLEQARLILHRAGERAAHVAEQRALEEVVVERGAVLHDERLLRAGPVIVDRARDQLLAGAALAVNEHGGLALHDLREQLHDIAHRRRVADDLVERVAERRRRDLRRQRAFDRSSGGHEQIAHARDVGRREDLRRGDQHRRLFLRAADRPDQALLHRGRVGVVAAGREHDAEQAREAVDRRRDDRHPRVAGLRDRRAILGSCPRRRELGQLVRARRAGDAAHRFAGRVRRPVIASALRVGEAHLEAPPAAQQVARHRDLGESIERQCHGAPL